MSLHEGVVSGLVQQAKLRRHRSPQIHRPSTTQQIIFNQSGGRSCIIAATPRTINQVKWQLECRIRVFTGKY
jgi:hypothetical protein